METKCLVDDTVEKGAIADICHVKVRFRWLDRIDLLSKLGLDFRVLAQFVCDPSQCCRSGVTTSHNQQPRVGIQFGCYFWLFLEQPGEDVLFCWCFLHKTRLDDSSNVLQLSYLCSLLKHSACPINMINQGFCTSSRPCREAKAPIDVTKYAQRCHTCMQ